MEMGHSRAQHSISLSESKVISIRNTSIYQDYRFQHLSLIETNQKSAQKVWSAYKNIEYIEIDESLCDVFAQS